MGEASSKESLQLPHHVKRIAAAPCRLLALLDERDEDRGHITPL